MISVLRLSYDSHGKTIVVCEKTDEMVDFVDSEFSNVCPFINFLGSQKSTTERSYFFEHSSTAFLSTTFLL